MWVFWRTLFLFLVGGSFNQSASSSTHSKEYLKLWSWTTYFSCFFLLPLRRLRRALTIEWSQMFINTWNYLKSPSDSFRIGRVKSSGLFSSVECLMRGVPSQVRGVSFDALKMSNSTGNEQSSLKKLKTELSDKVNTSLLTSP